MVWSNHASADDDWLHVVQNQDQEPRHLLNPSRLTIEGCVLGARSPAQLFR